MKFRGNIQTIFGPMFSGKTSELMRRIRRHRLAQKSCLVINFVGENRYSVDTQITSHDLVSIPALKVARLSQIPEEQLRDKQVIAIDEGQFFEDIFEKSEEWANQGKIVIVAALDCTFQMKPFHRITELLAISESVDKLSSVCLDCGKDAAFTKRTTDHQAIELMGGIEMYKPVCRACFLGREPESDPLQKTVKKGVDLKPSSANSVNKFEFD